MLSLQKINEICTGDRAEIINSETQTLLCVSQTLLASLAKEKIRDVTFTVVKNKYTFRKTCSHLKIFTSATSVPQISLCLNTAH